MPQYKMLLADDSVTIQKVVNLTFADEGIDVITVGDGDSAMEKIIEFKPDLVMADVNMPGLNGYQVCERIKEAPETRNLPVILLVGSFEPFDEAEAQRVGADDYMTKPFQSIRQLVNKVTALLGVEEPPEEEAESAEPAVTLEPEPPESPVEFERVDGETESAESAEAFEREPSETAEMFEPAEEEAEQSPEFIDTLETEPRPFAETDAGDMAAATLRMDAPPTPVFDYGDAGMDDEMIESKSAGEISTEIKDEDDYAKTQPLSDQELKEFAFVGGKLESESVPAPYYDSANTVKIDEMNLLDLPPLVEETGIRPALEVSEPEPVAAPVSEPAAPIVTEEMIAHIAARVVDRLAERIARALDADIVGEVTREVLREIDETSELS
jgi:CheY-like chemotaxis protein